MAKKENVSTSILTGLALLGGSFLFVEVLKAFGKKKVYYTCGNCQYSNLEYGLSQCPNCKINITWPKANQ